MGFRPVGELSWELLRGSAGSFGAKVAGAGLAFSASILLARLAGVEGYGTFAIAVSWLALLGVPAGLGLNQVVLRGVARAGALGQWSEARGLIVWSRRMVALSATAVALITILVITLGLHRRAASATLVALGAILIPLDGLVEQCVAGLRGLGQVVRSHVPGALLKPLTATLAAAALLTVPDPLGERVRTAYGALAVHGLSIVLALAVGLILLFKAVPAEIRRAKPVYETRQWLTAAIPMLLTGGLFMIQWRADVVMLGLLAGTEPAGIYQAANRVSSLVLFVLQSTNSVCSPLFAQFNARGQRSELQRLVSQSTVLAGGAATIVGIGLVLARGAILRLFGPEFTSGETTLVVLVVATLLNAFSGPVGALLLMTGHERAVAAAVGCSALGNVALDALLIPQFGMNGAAIATGLSMLLWNLILIATVRRRLGIRPTILGASYALSGSVET